MYGLLHPGTAGGSLVLRGCLGYLSMNKKLVSVSYITVSLDAREMKCNSD